MATIDSPTIIRKFLQNNGWYDGDPRAYAISTYVSAWGKKTYHVAYSHADVISAATSLCIDKLVLLWDRNGLTIAGQKELDQMYAREMR